MKASLSLALASLLLTVNAQTLTSNVTTSSGPIFGNARDANGILSFKGIPYAQPPVGNLRWKSPTTYPSSRTPIDATKFGATCWNFLVGGPPVGPQSEDCLTANIWTGANKTTELRPVMVFIYGGGFEFGSSSSPTYDGTKFAQDGVVLVSFNYRLGNFGFLALPQLDSEGTNSGMFGLQDQIFALRWVRQNIAAFGGDPGNILIFGESAGAHSVGMLMSSPLAQGSFNKAIMESGAWWDDEHGSITTFDQARQFGTAWTQRVGATTTSALRALSAQTIVNSNPYNPATDPVTNNFAPSIDRYVLQSAPGTVFQQGIQSRVPLLAGWNGAEELIFLPRALPHNTAAEFKADLPLLFGAKTPQALGTADLYPANTDAQANASASALIGDLVIREQTWEAADTQHSVTGSPVFVYYFTYTSAYSPVPAHTAELPFVFGSLTNNPAIGSTAPPTAADATFSQKVRAYWVNFARSSNPNGAGLTAWPAYAGAGSADILGLGNTIAPVNYDLSRFQFIGGFRTNGVLPTSWRAINVSEATA